MAVLNTGSTRFSDWPGTSQPNSRLPGKRRVVASQHRRITSMKPVKNRLDFVCLVVAVLSLAACSGVHSPSSGGGTGPYSIGGTVTNLTGTGLVLQNNAGDNLTVSAAGPFTFATKVASGGAHAVTVATQPTNPAQSCAVTGGSGAATANVTAVAVTCTNAA